MPQHLIDFSNESYIQFRDQLAGTESSGIYSVESKSGYLGRYQFGEPLLQDLGYYKGDKTSKNDWIAEWSGKDGITSKVHQQNLWEACGSGRFPSV
ncbi:MAG: hypothetical protein WC291_09960 [Thermodesulfovibrionales bacterium]|jgi:hypothetical protein